MSARNPRLRRSIWQGQTQAGVSGQFSFVALFNQSIGDSLIVVHDVEIGLAASDTCIIAKQDGLQGAVSGLPVNVVGNEPQRAGQLSIGSAAATPNNFFLLRVLANANWFWPHEYPFAVLLPGKSLVVYRNTVNTSLFVSYYWETVPAELYWQELDEIVVD